MPGGLRHCGGQGDLNSDTFSCYGIGRSRQEKFDVKFNVKPKTQALGIEPGAPSASL